MNTDRIKLDELMPVLKEVLPKTAYPNDLIQVHFSGNWLVMSFNTGNDVLPINQKTLNIYEFVEVCHHYAKDRGYKIITELRGYGVEWMIISSDESIFDDKGYTRLSNYWNSNIVESMIDAVKSIIKGFD